MKKMWYGYPREFYLAYVDRKGSQRPGWPGTRYVAEASLELEILLPQVLGLQ
jgi:hypothetical protein